MAKLQVALIKPLFFLSLMTGLPCCSSAPKTSTIKVALFGTDLVVESSSQKSLREIQSKIKLEKKRLNIAMDPDCKWRTSPVGQCKNTEIKLTQTLENLASLFQQETQGVFNIKRSSQAKRDFSGLSQGYFIDLIKSDHKAVINFSGDIFFSGGFVPKGHFLVGEPYNSRISFAPIKVNSGWIITSGSKKLGADIYSPEGLSEKNFNGDFLQMTLFAKPEFSGARLDAWTTALMAGGKDLLRQLWKNPNFSNKWAYFYFDKKGHPYCSKNLRCKLKGKDKVVIVPW